MISEVRAASRGIYGAPKVFQELKKAGVRTSRKRVARIMRDNGWAGTTRGCAKRPKGEVKQAAPQPCSAPDLVRRDFAAGGPNEVWFADITYVRTHQGWPCLAVVMDVWSRMIVGWSMSA
ncbi:IS3 family transposase, partial [Collinsella tanakaei]|uniref:IS3 family transposase n=1 Tax=Collinsella tanakaei TaxID=626935 RepID=UPI0019584A06